MYVLDHHVELARNYIESHALVSEEYIVRDVGLNNTKFEEEEVEGSDAGNQRGQGAAISHFQFPAFARFGDNCNIQGKECEAADSFNLPHKTKPEIYRADTQHFI